MDSNRPVQILIVEDNQDDSLLLTRQIAKAQIDEHVTVIGDGREALDFLLKLSSVPMAIFLDLNLPGLSGLELLERIKQQPRLQAIPVFVMTGSINPQDKARCAELGAEAYLTKPIALTTFIKSVTHLFPKR